MIKKSFYLFLLLCISIYQLYGQQITTDNTQSPQNLIQNLVGNNCASANNISSPINGGINNIISYGSFERNSSNFPLESGIILSTGQVTRAGNTTITDDLSDGEINWETDLDILSTLGIDQTLNATSITFDMVSANNFVSFRYLFASDEYQQDFPCNFRDVFAILIRRAGTTDPYVNMATVPSTNTEVSTNTIRPEISGLCDAQNDTFFQGYNIGSTNFNGHTNVLTANSPVIPGETYQIKFIIADHIDQRFDSAVFIEADSFGGAIDLGEDQSVCGSNLTLDAEINNPIASYSWFLNNVLIPGENTSTLDVNQSGIYTVEIELNTSGSSCVLSDEISIEIIPFQEANFITDIAVCDAAPSDGIYDFDFSVLKNDEIFAELPSTYYNISYHLSESDAQNNDNPISGIYQNTDIQETIFVRIESLSGDCLQVGSFDIIVNSEPFSTEITVNVCDGTLADLTFANIYILDPLITEFNNFSDVSYYLNEQDAINEVNELTGYPDFTDNPEFMIARIEGIDTGCFALERIYFNYFTSPDLGMENFIIDACVSPDYYDNQGSFIHTYNTVPITFNLEDAIAQIQSVFPNATVRILAPIIGDPRLITITGPSTTLPLGVSFDETYCETSLTLELHKNFLYNIIDETTVLYGCDDPSNDGIVDFNFDEVNAEIIEELDLETLYASNLFIEYYESEQDRQNGINQIDQSVDLTVNNSETLYMRSYYVVNGVEACSAISEVILNVASPPEVTSVTVDACGNFDPATNATTINLQPFLVDIQQGLFDVVAAFFATEEDASNNTNAIESVNISGNFGEVYARITDALTGCFSITTLNLNVIDSLNIASVAPIITCDNDLNGFEIVDLESALTPFSIDFTQYDVTYHLTERKANQNEDPISNPNNFNAQTQTIYVRIQQIGLDCFTVTQFDVAIYNQPFIDDNLQYISCITDATQPGDFLFVTKDLEIINGQEDMQVFYYETENDAINRNNPIDKTSAYQNTSNPQTIYIRLENEDENNCYAINTMQLEIRQVPLFNPPTDIVRCDYNGNGLNTIDLNEKVDQIIEGSNQNLNVTFHLTPLNAELGTNPIPYNFPTSINPQLIYTRIVNVDSGCYEVSTFNIQTLSLPDVNFGQSLIACGDNYNFNQEWDLTEIELLILDGRQFGIDFIYYESEVDLQNDSNRIINPGAYTNSINPQTIYAKVYNVNTTCYQTVPFDLIINSPPIINDFEIYSICDNNDNTVDLHDIDLILVDNTFNVLISYYQTVDDAENDDNALSTNYIYSNNIENLVARVEYTTSGCYAIYPFELRINPLPIANTPVDLMACDDDFDGLLQFDLTVQNTSILNGQNTNEFSITYFNSENDANENTNALDFNYLAFDSEVIYARLENNATGCYDITQFNVIINPKPIIDIEDKVICLNDIPLTVSADTGNPLDTYSWSTNTTSSEIEITEIGTYSVTVTNEFGCETTSTFNVTESESAVIDVVETIDFSDPNNITITVNGIGDYLYQLNDLSIQNSNVFVNVPIGYNTVTVIDQNGCARITREVLVIDAPKHITPNGDGDFDTWHIAGIETLPGTVIHIFDRFGKLLKELSHDTLGWDGTYNGNDMPSGDYWYVADVIQNGKHFQVKGHFALRR